MKVISLGSTGNEVKLLQSKLTLSPTGVFDTTTQIKLKDYQKVNLLTVDGVCGPKSWSKLLTTTKMDFTLSDNSFNILKVNKKDVNFKLSYDVPPVGIAAVVTREKPDFIMNAGMYNNNPGGTGWGITIVDTIVNSKVVGGGNYVPMGFGFNNIDAEILSTTEAKTKYPTYIGFSPDLVPNMNLKGLSSAFAAAKAYRTGIGTKGDYVYLITTNTTMDLYTFKNKFVSLGCTEVGNFDGGGSTQSALYINNMYIQTTNQTNSRKNATYLMLDVKEDVVIPPAPIVKDKVSVDLGHGGTDPGTSGGGMLEKNVNLNVGMEYNRLLLADGHYDVLMTRTADTAISLEARAAKINTFNPVFAISIHENATTAGGAYGYQTIYNVNKPASLKLANLINTEFSALGQTKNNSFSKAQSDGRDWYGIQRLTNCPTVITEFAFMNSPDVLDIDTLTEQKAIAMALYKATNKFFGR